LNVLIFSPKYFFTTLIELEPYLKFNLKEYLPGLNKENTSHDIVIIHKDFLDNKDQIKILIYNNPIVILASDENIKLANYDSVLKLPASLNEINSIVEQTISKKIFSKNSSILIKDYLLNKNEKKLIKDKNFIILTEKEIQLLDLFLV